jgi:hypothetical protein
MMKGKLAGGRKPLALGQISFRLLSSSALGKAAPSKVEANSFPL